MEKRREEGWNNRRGKRRMGVEVEDGSGREGRGGGRDRCGEKRRGGTWGNKRKDEKKGK